MAKGIRKPIKQALARISVEMRGYGDSKYARGLSSEGYAGGYAQALRDVLLLLDGIEPRDDRGYWGPSSYLAGKTAEANAERRASRGVTD